MRGVSLRTRIIGVLLVFSLGIGPVYGVGGSVLGKLIQEIAQFTQIINKLSSANSNVKEGLGQLQKLNDAMQKVSASIKGLKEVKNIAQGARDCMVILQSARQARLTSNNLSIEEKRYLGEVEINLIKMLTTEVNERVNSVALNNNLKMSDAERYEIIHQLSDQVTVFRDACMLHVYTQKRLEAENSRAKQDNDLAISLLYLR